MFSTEEYIIKQSEKSGRRGRFSYLQSLVTEFQDTDKQESKEQILGNLANFSYDPINYEHLRKLNVVALFLDMLSEENEKLMEFGIAGLCNLCLEPRNKKYILENEGIDAIIGCLSSSNEEVVLNAITTLMFLFSPESKKGLVIPMNSNSHDMLKDITCEEIVECMKQLLTSTNTRFKNLASIFLKDYVRGEAKNSR